jgi:hypothetical protein
MKCYDCGAEYTPRHEKRMRADDKAIGTFHVADVSYLECSNCRQRLYSPDDARKIEDARASALDAILRSMPLGAFVSAQEATKLLGVTRQALHKHRRISRGFIYQTTWCGSRVYLLASVEQFKKTEDGRIILRRPEATPASYVDGPRETAAPRQATGWVATAVSAKVNRDAIRFDVLKPAPFPPAFHLAKESHHVHR